MGFFAQSDEKVYFSRFGRVRNLCVKANSNAGFNHIPFDFMWLTSSFY